jgi:hypothetical protein
MVTKGKSRDVPSRTDLDELAAREEWLDLMQRGRWG